MTADEWFAKARCTEETAGQVWATARTRAREAVKYDPARSAVVEDVRWTLPVWEQRLAVVEGSAREALFIDGLDSTGPLWDAARTVMLNGG